MKKMVIAYVFILMVAGVSGWAFSSWIAGQVEDDATEVSFVVVDPPANLDAQVLLIGFRPGERSELPELAMNTQVIHAPRGYSEARARAVLRDRLPELTFDFDELAWSY